MCGSIALFKCQSILFQQIGNVESEEPLLVTFENDKTRGAVLFGENSWRWRMSSKVEENSFKPFDEFMNKLIQYLSSDKKDFPIKGNVS